MRYPHPSFITSHSLIPLHSQNIDRSLSAYVPIRAVPTRDNRDISSNQSTKSQAETEMGRVPCGRQEVKNYRTLETIYLQFRL